MNPTTRATTNSWARPSPESYASWEPRLKLDREQLTHDNVYWDDSFSKAQMQDYKHRSSAKDRQSPNRARPDPIQIIRVSKKNHS